LRSPGFPATCAAMARGSNLHPHGSRPPDCPACRPMSDRTVLRTTTDSWKSVAGSGCRFRGRIRKRSPDPDPATGSGRRLPLRGLRDPPPTLPTPRASRAPSPPPSTRPASQLRTYERRHYSSTDRRYSRKKQNGMGRPWSR
jgi:hypothetical protein